MPEHALDRWKPVFLVFNSNTQLYRFALPTIRNTFTMKKPKVWNSFIGHWSIDGSINNDSLAAVNIIICSFLSHNWIWNCNTLDCSSMDSINLDWQLNEFVNDVNCDLNSIVFLNCYCVCMRQKNSIYIGHLALFTLPFYFPAQSLIAIIIIIIIAREFIFIIYLFDSNCTSQIPIQLGIWKFIRGIF